MIKARRLEKLRYFLICIFFFFLLFFLFAGNWEKNEEDPEDNIVIYTREVDDSPLREFWGETIVETSLGALVALCRDADAFPEWMHNVDHAEHLEVLNDIEFVTYTIQSTPWPASDRDMVSYARIDQEPDTKRVTIQVEARPDYYPEQDEYVRIPRMTGMWEFRPIGEGRIKVVYQALVDPGGWIPDGFADAYAVNTPLETLRGLREMIDKPQYRDAQVEGIQEPE